MRKMEDQRTELRYRRIGKESPKGKIGMKNEKRDERRGNKKNWRKDSEKQIEKLKRRRHDNERVRGRKEQEIRTSRKKTT